MIDFAKLIRKTFPEYNELRHYYSDGDLILFSEDYIGLCIKFGFTKCTVVIVKGFDKGNQRIFHQHDLPYIPATEWNPEENLRRIEELCIPAKRLSIQLGDIFKNPEKDCIFAAITEEAMHTFFAYCVKDTCPERKHKYTGETVAYVNPYAVYMN